MNKPTIYTHKAKRGAKCMTTWFMHTLNFTEIIFALQTYTDPLNLSLKLKYLAMHAKNIQYLLLHVIASLNFFNFFFPG